MISIGRYGRRSDEAPGMELTVDGNRVYAATGNRILDTNAETVVFVHGVGQDHTVWVLPTRYFASHGRNVMAVDLPGHGRSEGSPLATIEDMSRWLVGVLDAAGIERAAIVGNSMGSLVTIDTAGRFPDRVRAGVCVGVSFPLKVSDALRGAAEASSHDALDMLTYWGHSDEAIMGGNDTPGVWMTGVTMRLLERADPATIAIDLGACDGYQGGLAAAATIEAPFLFLLGSRDRMTPVRGAAELIAQVKMSKSVVFDGAGHALLSERPDQVLDELIRVL